jgi:hypothetical protein
MKIIEAICIAGQSLWANKLRSLLSLLGVMIGVLRGSMVAVGAFVGLTLAKGITFALGMPSAIKLWAVASGGVSGSVGVFVGVYPASNAARLDPSPHCVLKCDGTISESRILKVETRVIPGERKAT